MLKHGTGDRTWTDTANGHRILSPACLPIPPRRHMERVTGLEPATFSLARKCSSQLNYTRFWWNIIQVIIYKLFQKSILVGALRGTWTPDRLLKRQLLYQLSYKGWYRREDSNLHTLRYLVLNQACLPVSPLRLKKIKTVFYLYLKIVKKSIIVIK